LGIRIIPPHETTHLPGEYLAGLLPGIRIHAKGEITEGQKNEYENKAEKNKKEEPPSRTEEKK
jgi:hypothetical protein